MMAMGSTLWISDPINLVKIDGQFLEKWDFSGWLRVFTVEFDQIEVTDVE
jgi:hypothetical protein